MVNPTSPTSFNTLSNVYATAIDRSTPVTAINTKQSLKIQTQNLFHGPYVPTKPFVSTYPETPLTAQPISPAVANLQDVRFPSTMTATPPLSAGPTDSYETKSFSFTPADTATSTLPTALSSDHASATANTAGTTPTSAIRSGRRATAPVITAHRPGAPMPPYARNRSLHSILRNSPLPPPTARTPISPRRQSQRLAEKATRRVGYESPIERVIETNQYVHSHIELLLSAGEDAGSSGGVSPCSSSPSSAVMSPSSFSDPILGLAGDDTRDGGMTPGPFEEMRRRMGTLATRTPTSPAGGSGMCALGSSPAGVRKRRKRESRRRWVWTIGTSEEEDEEDGSEVGGAVAAVRAAARGQLASSSSFPSTTPTMAAPMVVVQSPMDVATPSVETAEDVDVVMAGSEPEPEPEPEFAGPSPIAERRVMGSTTLGDMDIDTATPTVARRSHGQLEPPSPRSTRQDSEGLFNPETGSRRDTPVPADMVPVQ